MAAFFNKINAEILRLAVPNIISNVSVPLISAVDTALMGHLSLYHLGAIGLGSMIFNFVYWNFGFLRMGTTGMVAQAYGEQDEPRAAQIGVRSLIIALCIGTILLICSQLIFQASSYGFNISEDQIPLVRDYFFIRIWAAPAAISLYVFMGWLFGMQNAIYPLMITVFINVINVLLSLWLVVGQGMDIRGVAIGTVVAQYAGAMLALFLIYHRYRSLFLLKWTNLRGRLDDWISLFNVNAFLFVRTACLTFAFAFFYSQSSREGALILATHVVLLQFLNWVSYGIDGFAFASESLVGKYYGANEKDKLLQVVRYILGWGFILATFYSSIYFIFEMNILHLFTSDSEVVDMAMSYRYSMIALPFLGFLCYIWDGVFIGLTEVRLMMYSMLISLIIYLLLYFTLVRWEMMNLWSALIFFLVIRGLVQSFLWELKIKKNILL